MQFKEVYLSRRSIRRYKDKEIPLETIAEIIDLASYAPSSGNIQNWRMIVVTSTETKHEIMESCIQQGWMMEAPVFIVVCNDYEKVKEHYGKLGKMYSIQNCSNIAFGLTLVAKEHGLGSCWVGAFDEEAVRRILKIPENIDPEIIITLGYTEETKSPSLRELPNYITFFNSWGKNTFPFKSHLTKLKQAIKKPFNK
ncbi:nitroreductase family protein [Candidatus Woesearchaeota archaeon]|nr:nitroreductase family protein [Candidatus Woesearchaeota archaeon]